MGNNLRKKSLVVLSVLGVATLALCVAAQAATVRINPTKIRLIIPPGSSRSGTIEVDNPSDEPIIVKAYVEDWVYTSFHDGTKDFFPAGTAPLSCSKWISASLSEFAIPAFSQQKVNYTVKVPADAGGGHYSVLFFETFLSKPEAGESAQLGVMVRIGALFYIEPQGTIKREAELSDFSVQRKNPKSPIDISIDLQNTGNVDLTCAGTYHIMDSQGMIFSRGEFNSAYLFPGEKAKLSGQGTGSIPKGRYSLVVTIDIGKALEEAKLGRGPVIIREAEVEFGEGGEVLAVGQLK